MKKLSYAGGNRYGQVRTCLASNGPEHIPHLDLAIRVNTSTRTQCLLLLGHLADVDHGNIDLLLNVERSAKLLGNDHLVRVFRTEHAHKARIKLLWVSLLENDTTLETKR